MNLIEQQNILRGLADDALKNEMSGNVPPYLVLAEVNRRKSARERYEAANAKYRANQPTVAEELIGQMPQAGIDTALTGGGMRAPGPMAMPAGIDAAMPQPRPQPQLQPQPQIQQQPQSFADGGVVGYEGGGVVDLISAYNARLSSTDADRKNAQRMALMNIGAQIMAGRSSNTLSNIGSGLSAALPSYQQSMERLNTQEMQGLRDQIDLARQMEQDQLSAEDRTFNRERQMEQDQRSKQDREFSRDLQTKQLGISEQGLMPADVREAMWYENASAAEKAAYDKVRATDQANENLRISTQFNNLNKTVARRYIRSDGSPTDAVPGSIRAGLESLDPNEVALAQDNLQRLIKQEAIDEFRVNFPDYGSFADKVEESLNKVDGASGGSTALPNGTILKAEDFF